MTVGKLIITYRKKIKLTSEQFAAKIAVKPKMVDAWEKSTTIPPLNKCQDIIRILGIDNEVFFSSYTTQKIIQTYDSASLLYMSLAMLILVGYFFSFGISENGFTFLFTPSFSLHTHLISYLGLWMNFLCCFTIIGLCLYGIIKGNVVTKKKIFKVILYLLIPLIFGIGATIISDVNILDVGYVAVVLFTLIFTVFYFIFLRRLYRFTKQEKKYYE